MKLTDAEIEEFDAFHLLAAVGKKVVHPGGRRSTSDLFRMARIEPQHHVLEVGCGPGITAVEMAERFGARVTAVDIDDLMLDLARRTVAEHRAEERVTIERQDIQQLDYPDDTFDRVIVEAVTMFVDVERATREVVRVCKPGGIVVDHEFIWRKRPPAGVRDVFQIEVCRMDFETREFWEELYRRAGLTELETVSGEFVMMTPRGFIRDEGFSGALSIAARSLSRRVFIRKFAWNLKRIIPAIPYLGWVVTSGIKRTTTQAVDR